MGVRKGSAAAQLGISKSQPPAQRLMPLNQVALVDDGMQTSEVEAGNSLKSKDSAAITNKDREFHEADQNNNNYVTPTDEYTCTVCAVQDETKSASPNAS